LWLLAGQGLERRRREAVLRPRRALPSRGREYLYFYERSEIKRLVTRDRVPSLKGISLLSPRNRNPPAAVAESP
jgi:hypothetical protein